MVQAVFFDCEFLTAPGAPSRFWCGPDDPDPRVIQIGAVFLNLGDPYDLGDRLSLIIAPHDRFGDPVGPDPLVTEMTGLTPLMLASGLPLVTALDRFVRFVGDAPIWSWGKDELNLMAITCWLAGIPAPLGPDRFGNATRLAARAGLDRDIIHRTRSNTLPQAFGMNPKDLKAHDALSDAFSVALTVQHLLRNGRLTPEDVQKI